MANNLPFTLLTSEAVLSIVNNRKEYGIIERSQIGERLAFTVQGNGNILPVTKKDGMAVQSRADGGQLFKKIYNVKSLSRIAMNNPVIRQLLTDGLAAEQAGDKVAAHAAFNSYLNKIQISFNLLLPNTLADDITANTTINANVELISNPQYAADGVTITEVRELISLKDISVPRIKAAAKPVGKFMLTDLLGLPTAGEADALFQPDNAVVGAGEQTLAQAGAPVTITP